MGILQASKAKRMSTAAMNVDSLSRLLLNNLVAVSARTELGLLGNIHKRIDKMHLVLFILLL